MKRWICAALLLWGCETAPTDDTDPKKDPEDKIEVTGYLVSALIDVTSEGPASAGTDTTLLVVGRPQSAPAGSVTVTNQRTAEQVEGVVNTVGGFAVRLSGRLGDALDMVHSDAQRSDELSLTVQEMLEFPPLNPNGVEISSGPDFETGLRVVKVNGLDLLTSGGYLATNADTNEVLILEPHPDYPKIHMGWMKVDDGQVVYFQYFNGDALSYSMSATAQ